MFSAEEMAIIAEANRILESKLRAAPVFSSPSAVKNFLKTEIAHKEHEVFVVLFLNGQHQLIVSETMFRGTIDCASVYPREVAKAALAHNAAAVIFAHNHPSDGVEPSDADRHITQRLTDALALFDIRVLDHLVVGKGRVFSFAESGLI